MSLRRKRDEEVLGVVDDFRTFDWVEMVKYPELVLTQSKQLLNAI